MNYSPIAIFVYKRPAHTRRMIESLMRCPEFEHSQVHVFSDAPRKIEDEQLVQETRYVVNTMLGEKAKIVNAQTNRGLAVSIISGVTSLLAEYDRIIVLEDDLLLSPRFLGYMNTALMTYQDNPSVMQVSGYMVPVKEFIDRNEVVFLPFTSSWGWATWQRAWEKFDADAVGWQALKTDSAMKSRFNLDGAYNYYSMIESQMIGGADSWAIRWYWSVFKNNAYVVYPPISHVDNIGFDGSGTHGSFTGKEFSVGRNLTFCSSPENMPLVVKVNVKDYEDVTNAIRRIQSGWKSKLRNILHFVGIFRC
jgi:hypothetical protein